jgi:hypothetical protein
MKIYKTKIKKKKKSKPEFDFVSMGGSFILLTGCCAGYIR